MPRLAAVRNRAAAVLDRRALHLRGLRAAGVPDGASRGRRAVLCQAGSPRPVRGIAEGRPVRSESPR